MPKRRNKNRRQKTAHCLQCLETVYPVQSDGLHHRLATIARMMVVNKETTTKYHSLEFLLDDRVRHLQLQSIHLTDSWPPK